jgi:hypothetical protein
MFFLIVFTGVCTGYLICVPSWVVILFSEKYYVYKLYQCVVLNEKNLKYKSKGLCKYLIKCIYNYLCK